MSGIPPTCIFTPGEHGAVVIERRPGETTWTAECSCGLYLASADDERAAFRMWLAHRPCTAPDHPAPFYCRDCGGRACCCVCVFCDHCGGAT